MSKISPKRSALSPEKLKRLKAEVKAPYKPIRKFVYGGLGASGFIGAVCFLAQIAAGRDLAMAIPNFALQVGLVALMAWLFLLESR